MDETNSEQQNKILATQKSDECRKLYAYLLLAGKNFSLYPAGHSITANAVKLFHTKLTAAIGRWGDLKIEIERDRVLCQGVDVHKGPLEDRTIPCTLFRDGIRWLLFEEGVTLEETLEILSIIHRYANLSAESEGDIVTDLWESRFPHVRYEAADFFTGSSSDWAENLISSGTDREAGFSRKDAAAQASSGSASEEKGGAADGGSLAAAVSIDPAMLMLGPREQAALADMIHREETASASAHLNMLLDSLLQFDEEADCRIILDVLGEEFYAALGRHDFEAALLILEGLHYLLESGRMAADHARQLIEAFFIRISEPAVLRPLEDIWRHIDLYQASVLERIFHRLHPRALETLAALLLVAQPPKLEKMVEEAAMALIRRDENILAELIRQADERIGARIIPVLYKLNREISGRHLVQLTRHTSAPVRRMAVKALVHGRKMHPADMVEYLDDEDEAIRRLILRQLGQERDDAAEGRLLQYLQTHKFAALQADWLVDCFKTLGKCGSSRSIPFLREVLLRRKWMAGLEKSPYREGALRALDGLKIPEARQVIDEAGHSFFPGLRRLAREVDRKNDILKHKGGG